MLHHGLKRKPLTAAVGPYEISNMGATPDQTYDAGAAGGGGAALAYIYFKSDGTKLFTALNGVYRRFSLPTAWSLTGMSYDSNTKTVTTGTATRGFVMKPDGTKIIATDNGTVLYSYALTTAFDLSTMQTPTSKTGMPSQCRGIGISDDGLKGIVLTGSLTMQSFTMSTAWDISTLSMVAGTKTVATNEGGFVIPSGLRVLTTKDSITQYTLSTAWDVSTVGASTVTKTGSGRTGFIGDNGYSFYEYTAGGILRRYYLT